MIFMVHQKPDNQQLQKTGHEFESVQFLNISTEKNTLAGSKPYMIYNHNIGIPGRISFPVSLEHTSKFDRIFPKDIPQEDNIKITSRYHVHFKLSSTTMTNLRELLDSMLQSKIPIINFKRH